MYPRCGDGVAGGGGDGIEKLSVPNSNSWHQEVIASFEDFNNIYIVSAAQQCFSGKAM